MNKRIITSRRNFLKASLLGGVAASAFPAPFLLNASENACCKGESCCAAKSRVSLTHGDDHTDNVFKALKAHEAEIKKAIGDRRVIIKPNNVSTSVQLCATHVDCIEGILEFMKSIGKLDNIAIAESAASAPTMEGYDNYGYPKITNKYGAKLIDLDKEPVKIMHVIDEKDFHPHPFRAASLMLDPDVFLVSAAVMKTHDRVMATLSLKNIVVGAPIKDDGFRWGRGRKKGAINDKPIIHGSGIKGVNYNLYALAPKLHPNLAVIDGYQGMQGNGPVGGTPVDHKVCVAGLDWLAADRVAVELMGIDYATVGYLNYCAKAGMGEADLKQITVLGEKVTNHIKKYKLHDNVEKQKGWMTS